MSANKHSVCVCLSDRVHMYVKLKECVDASKPSVVCLETQQQTSTHFLKVTLFIHDSGETNEHHSIQMTILTSWLQDQLSEMLLHVYNVH